MFIFLRIFIIFLYIFIIYTSVVKCYNVKSINTYRKLTIEDDKLCSPLTKRKIELKTKEYQSVIVTQTTSRNHPLTWPVNWFCKYTIDASSHGGLFAVIQKINFRKNADGDCIDYIQFRRDDGATSKKICGDYPNVELTENARLSASQGVVSFGGKIDTEIFIHKSSLRSDETMDLMIVYTAFKSCNELTLPYTCKAESSKFCINGTFFNDSIVNCPFDWNCQDEGTCETFVRDFYDSAPNADDTSMVTKVVLSAVTSLFISFVCVIVVIWMCRKMGSACCLSLNMGEQNEGSSSSRAQSRVIEMQNRNENDDTITNVSPPSAADHNKDLPPSYESLFPQPQR